MGVENERERFVDMVVTIFFFFLKVAQKGKRGRKEGDYKGTVGI